MPLACRQCEVPSEYPLRHWRHGRIQRHPALSGYPAQPAHVYSPRPFAAGTPVVVGTTGEAGNSRLNVRLCRSAAALTRSADGTKQVPRTSPHLNRRRRPLNPAVTIVLPVHNAQRTLRSSLLGLMELAETTGPRLQVAVVDDGSTDATYEIACDLASEFPQIHVLASALPAGTWFGARAGSSRLGVTDVVAHNGVGEIDHQELAMLLAAGTERRDAPHANAATMTGEGRGTRRAGSQPASAPRLAKAHRTGGAFRWLRIDEPATSRRKRSATPVLGAASRWVDARDEQFRQSLGRRQIVASGASKNSSSHATNCPQALSG